jgi:hypothetical protein
MSVCPVQRFGLIAVLAALVTAASGISRADDLDRVRAQQEVEAQKVFEDVKDSLAQARKLERTQPAEAARLLRKCLGSVENDTTLTEQQRTALVRQLRNAVRDMGDAARTKAARDTEGARFADQRPQRAPAPGAKPSDAAKTARDLYEASKGRQAENAKLKAAKDAGYAAAVRGTDEAAVPTDKALVFAPSYAYRAAQRGKQQLTDKEKALIKALSAIISVDYAKKTFREVIDDLADRSGQAIILDQDSLKEAMVEYDDPVTLKVRVTMRTALKKILADRGLTYVLKDGTIQVVTPQKARETLVARAYPVGDLASSLDMRFPPLLRRVQMLQNVAQIIDLIQNSIDPSSWQANGGPGTITFYEPTMSLVIRQTAEMHYQLGGYLSH